MNNITLFNWIYVSVLMWLLLYIKALNDYSRDSPLSFRLCAWATVVCRYSTNKAYSGSNEHIFVRSDTSRLASRLRVLKTGSRLTTIYSIESTSQSSMIW